MSLELVLIPPKEEETDKEKEKQILVKFLLCLLDIRNDINKC